MGRTFPCSTSLSYFSVRMKVSCKMSSATSLSCPRQDDTPEEYTQARIDGRSVRYNSYQICSPSGCRSSGLDEDCGVAMSITSSETGSGLLILSYVHTAK